MIKDRCIAFIVEYCSFLPSHFGSAQYKLLRHCVLRKRKKVGEMYSEIEIEIEVETEFEVEIETETENGCFRDIY